jgi:NAD(P)-dependent dehydrogenase (short-subunit alcohol dehydrogenase family)
MRNVLVTGSTGIGGAVAAALGERAVTIGRGGTIRADLGLLSETSRAADEVLARGVRLDAIVCCAGVFALRAELTEEGLERSFVLNYLSRFLLVRRLLPALAPDGRVVLVANAGRYRDTLGDLAGLGGRLGRGLRVAGRTQFANDLFAVELAERHPELAVSCVFPGPVATRVFRDARGVPGPLRRVLDAVQHRVGATAAEAAATPVALAVGARPASGFYGPKGEPVAVPVRVREGRRAGLWAVSEELTGGRWPAAAEGTARRSPGTT